MADESLDLSVMIDAALVKPIKEMLEFGEYIRLKKAQPHASHEDIRAYMAFMRVAPSSTPDASVVAELIVTASEGGENSRAPSQTRDNMGVDGSIFHGGDTRTIDSRPYHRGDGTGWGGNGLNSGPNSAPNIGVGHHHRGSGPNHGGGHGQTGNRKGLKILWDVMFWGWSIANS